MSTDARDLRRRAWRWHFIAAVLVIPFVLWQSVTGVIYLWADRWVDHQHPELRFVPVGSARASLDAQVEAARAQHPGQTVAGLRVPGDPARSTQVTFLDEHGLPAATFVDPYRGTVLGTLAGGAWPTGWSRSLHGGWPLGDAGSWLLEIGACWTLVMVFTGLFLWWPRDGRGLRALLPRLGEGPRLFWRDLHACVAVWFAFLIVAFLFTALPWTSFWGGRILQPLQRELGQDAPRAAGFAPVFAGTATAGADPLQRMLDSARGADMRGDLMFHWVDGPPGAAVSVRDLKARSADERYLLLDRADGAVIEQAQWGQFPVLAKAVAVGVDVHEASYFGAAGPWVNTVFAAILVWLGMTGALSWWRRKPRASLGVPARSTGPWPPWLRAIAAFAFLLLPLLAVSAVALWAIEIAITRATTRVRHA